MRFLAEAGVAQRVVEWLRASRHDAVHLREQGLNDCRIPRSSKKAALERRVVLTFDLDFGEIVAFSPASAASVIVFRLHDTRTQHVIERLQKVLADSADPLEQAAVTF